MPTLEETNMKMDKPTLILAIFLFASLALNAFEWRQHCRLMHLQTLKDHYPYIEAKFPIDGATYADISDILKSLDSTVLVNARSGMGILSIEVRHDDYVLVEIGYIEGGLDGTGRTFGFIRTPQGWEFDETSRGCRWKS